MKDRKTAFAAALLYLALSSPLRAHHSFASFDMTKTLTMLCTVKEFQWLNPHSWLIVVAPDDAGVLQEYRFEGVPPAILTRSGWTEDTLLVGDRISLDYHPHKDGEAGRRLRRGHIAEWQTPRDQRLLVCTVYTGESSPSDSAPTSAPVAPH